MSDEYATTVSEAPLRVEVRIPLEDETLRVTVDEALEVVETERIAGVSSPRSAT